MHRAVTHGVPHNEFKMIRADDHVCTREDAINLDKLVNSIRQAGGKQVCASSAVVSNTPESVVAAKQSQLRNVVASEESSEDGVETKCDTGGRGSAVVRPTIIVARGNGMRGTHDDRATASGAIVNGSGESRLRDEMPAATRVASRGSDDSKSDVIPQRAAAVPTESETATDGGSERYGPEVSSKGENASGTQLANWYNEGSNHCTFGTMPAYAFGESEVIHVGDHEGLILGNNCLDTSSRDEEFLKWSPNDGDPVNAATEESVRVTVLEPGIIGGGEPGDGPEACGEL